MEGFISEVRLGGSDFAPVTSDDVMRDDPYSNFNFTVDLGGETGKQMNGTTAFVDASDVYGSKGALTQDEAHAVFIGQDSFIYTVIDDGSSARSNTGASTDGGDELTHAGQSGSGNLDSDALIIVGQSTDPQAALVHTGPAHLPNLDIADDSDDALFDPEPSDLSHTGTGGMPLGELTESVDADTAAGGAGGLIWSVDTDDFG